MGSDSDTKEVNNKNANLQQNYQNHQNLQPNHSKPVNVHQNLPPKNPPPVNEYQNNNSTNTTNTTQNNTKDEEENNYTLEYNDNDLMKMLSSFIENFKYQDSIYGLKEGNEDPVFNDINENQKKMLIDYFLKNKKNISNALLSFLNSKPLNVSNNIITDLMRSEDSYSIYEKKVIREIDKINRNKDLFKIKYLTILVVGKTGVGKSTLINEMLKLEGNNRAPENATDSETFKITAYQSNEIPFLRLVDTRGLELGQYDHIALLQDCSAYFNEQRRTKDFNKFIHCIWYCVTGARLEKVELQAIELLKKSNNISNIPLIIVYTQSYNLELIEAREKNVQENKIANDYVSILARGTKQPSGGLSPSFGLPELLTKTLNECKKALNGDMHKFMTNNIAEYIYNNLIIENSNIRKYIIEKNILNCTNNYNNIKNKHEFQDFTINVYGKTINSFLNKDLSNTGKNIIKTSYIISIHNNNYINFYLDIINQIISKELHNLSINGLISQAVIEKKKGMSTLIQNKRDLDDFSKQNTQYLSDNFGHLAQKYYIFNILQSSSIEFSNLIEQYLNNLIKQILNHPNIGNRINHLFQQRFKEFKEKIVDKNLISKMENDEISNFANNDNKVANGQDKYTEKNGKILIDFTNNEKMSLKTDSFSNSNTNLVNSSSVNFSNLNSVKSSKNLIINVNKQPDFKKNKSQKTLKAWSDIKSTQTVNINPNYQLKSNNLIYQGQIINHNNKLHYNNSKNQILYNNPNNPTLTNNINTQRQRENNIQHINSNYLNPARYNYNN